jgi:hypothetical protein
MANTKIIEAKVRPEKIATEFIIQELIKMFPEASEDFYDKIRYYMRQYLNNYSEARFWRLVAGFSDYMLKRYYRMLYGDEYEWSYEEIPLSELQIRMFTEVKVIGKILEKVNYNAAKAGEIIRKLSPEERMKYLDPFKFSKDYYPIVVEEKDDGNLVVHDGNRRALNYAIYGYKTIKAYVGKKRKKPEKPAIPETFFPQLMSILDDNKEKTDELVKAVYEILAAAKEQYCNGQELVKLYTEKYFLPMLKNNKQKAIVEKLTK